jgi:DNA-binding winged helix-turn-helix (wHTH) protein
MLLLFVTHPAEILSGDVLSEAGWNGDAVAPNNTVQTLSRLRKSLGTQSDGTDFFENVARRGYRFLAKVGQERSTSAPLELDAHLAPFSAFMTGSEALETLDLDQIARARLPGGVTRSSGVRRGAHRSRERLRPAV